MKIAIIGAGVSGLSLAYYLHKYSEGKIEVVVYEQADRVGGNALTQELDLSPLGRPNTWVDMGVNDFNINTFDTPQPQGVRILSSPSELALPGLRQVA